MSNSKRILFLYQYSDESRPFVQALRDRGFDVEVITSVDEALYAIEHKRPYDLLVWTMWLHPGARLSALGSARHGDGTKTGACFVEIARRIYPIIPMLLFTRDRVLKRQYSRPQEHHYGWDISFSGPKFFAEQVFSLLRGSTAEISR